MTASSSARTVDGTDASFDARWAHWQAVGLAQDRALDRTAAVIAVLAFSALAAWLALAIYAT
jgi:hypothetical protein